MSKDQNISLVIPSISSSFFVNDLLKNIFLWSLVPSEIIFINTSKKKIEIYDELKKLIKKKKIDVKIIKKRLYPGAARNLGILNTKYNYIVFLDMNTVVYNQDWLKVNFNYMLKYKLDGLFGQTYYLANSYKEKIIRASTFGKRVLTTIPGSIYTKKTIKKVGSFNSITRAGEDADWLSRLNNLNLNVKNSLQPIYYKGLYNVTYFDIVKKWFRNYSFSANLPHLKNQKNLYFLLLFTFIFLSLVNWSTPKFNLDADLKIFIPHVSKIFIGLSILIYISIRGFYIPVIKKIKLRYLLPYNIFLISIFSFTLDVVKLLAFSLSYSLKWLNLDIKKYKRLQLLIQ